MEDKHDQPVFATQKTSVRKSVPVIRHTLASKMRLLKANPLLGKEGFGTTNRSGKGSVVGSNESLAKAANVFDRMYKFSQTPRPSAFQTNASHEPPPTKGHISRSKSVLVTGSSQKPSAQIKQRIKSTEGRKPVFVIPQAPWRSGASTSQSQVTPRATNKVIPQKMTTPRLPVNKSVTTPRPQIVDKNKNPLGATTNVFKKGQVKSEQNNFTAPPLRHNELGTNGVSRSLSTQNKPYTVISNYKPLVSTSKTTLKSNARQPLVEHVNSSRNMLNTVKPEKKPLTGTSGAIKKQRTNKTSNNNLSKVGVARPEALEGINQTAPLRRSLTSIFRNKTSRRPVLKRSRSQPEELNTTYECEMAEWSQGITIVIDWPAVDKEIGVQILSVSTEVSSLWPGSVSHSSHIFSTTGLLGLLYSSPMASLVLTDSSQLTSDSQHLDVHSPIQEELEISVKNPRHGDLTSAKRVRFYSPRAKKTLTPQMNVYTPKPSELRTNLVDWLEKRGKSVTNFHHLHCFGLHASEVEKEANKRINLKKHVNLSSQAVAVSPTTTTTIQDKQHDIMTPQKLGAVDEERHNPICSSTPNQSPSVTPNQVQDSLEDKENVFRGDLDVLAQDSLNDLYKLIQTGYPRDKCEEWLDVILKNCRSAFDKPTYWECLASLEESRGDFSMAIECYSRAIIRGAQPEEIGQSLDQLLQTFGRPKMDAALQELGDKKMSRKSLDARNVFKSTIIKFALQQRAIKQVIDGESKVSRSQLVVTPVRRSTRKSSFQYQHTPDMRYVDTLTTLEERERNTMVFQPNKMLLPPN
ncbi:unnamed protein product [Timema podura]|uniref:Cytoskeleton-associated protein 2 C-terminal domain-containing protein n=1 Tax=Timema podura TaxID=61482 RepID=A0ABN7NIX4_TIMPD|nr:unnamed protein product [Timema podura]